jgi:FMN phosphatase YigB (HAD superfamily)
VAADRCVFVDDLDVNCDAARELGMTAVRYESPGQAIPAIRAAFSAARSSGA